MKSESFSLHRVENDVDVEGELDLMRRVFGRESAVDRLVERLMDRHPSMTLGNHFVIKHESRIVACLVLIPVEWSIGGVLLRVAEMGCVGTLPEFRRRGLIKRLVEEYHRELENVGYDLSVIEGIPYFYRQFGYEYAIPLNEETRIEIEKLPGYEMEHEIRSFEGSDIPRAMSLLNHSQSKFYVHSVRSKCIWEIQHETNIDSEQFQAYAVEKGDEVVAYFRLTEKGAEKTLFLREVSETDVSTSRSIIRFLKDLCEQKGLETLSAQISYLNPLSEQLASFGGVQRKPAYAWQIRITDHTKIFQRIKPLLEDRLAGSPYHDFFGNLNFNFWRFTVRLSIENGSIGDIRVIDGCEDRSIGLNPLAFAQLLTGYRSLEELESTYPDCRVHPNFKRMIDALFPKMPSYIHVAY